MTTAVTTQEMDRGKIDLIKQTVAKGATDLELDLFLHACKRTGLDPLMKQIYAIKRWSAADKRETMSFQTGIDGYRLIADRTGCYAGSDEPSYLLGEDGFPDVASVTVYKLVGGQRCGFSASARWHEYCQLTKEGQPTSMWKKMPFLMLAKCAEALALRKAFPAELSGVYTHEEMMQADNEPSRPMGPSTLGAAVQHNKVKAQAALAELRDEAAHSDVAHASPSLSDAEWKRIGMYWEDDPNRADILTAFKDQEGVAKLSTVKPENRRAFVLALHEFSTANGIKYDDGIA